MPRLTSSIIVAAETSVAQIMRKSDRRLGVIRASFPAPGIDVMADKGSPPASARLNDDKDDSVEAPGQFTNHMVTTTTIISAASTTGPTSDRPTVRPAVGRPANPFIATRAVRPITIMPDRPRVYLLRAETVGVRRNVARCALFISPAGSLGAGAASGHGHCCCSGCSQRRAILYHPDNRRSAGVPALTLPVVAVYNAV